MTPIAHISSGYLASQMVNLINPNLGFDKPEIIIPTIIGAMISDIDILFVKNVKDHRDSVLHQPFFWLIILIISYLFSSLMNNELFKMINIGFGLGMFSHFFLDWLTVEEKGVGDMKLLYPFSNKRFAFKPRLPTGKIYSNKYVFSMKYVKSYMMGRFLFLEIFFAFFGILVFLLKSNILKLLIN